MNVWKLKYLQPAAAWNEALPLGNGRLGAMLYGGVESETWNITELTAWSGKKEVLEGNGRGKENLKEIRKHFFAGDYAEGEEAAKQHLQPPKGNYGTNLPVCDLLFHFNHQQDAGAYCRELNLNEAIARVTYQVKDIIYTRETFASNSDGVLAARFSCETRGAVSFRLQMKGMSSEFVSYPVGEDTLGFKGQALESNHSDGRCGVFFYGLTTIVAQGGRIYSAGSEIVVEEADDVCVYFAASTDYEAEAVGAVQSWIHECHKRLDHAVDLGYEQLKKNHITDYQGLFNRTDIKLGSGMEDECSTGEQSTDERIRSLRNGMDDPQLFALFFQYGRYLMIAGSRANSPLPIHLQGIWNDNEASRMEWSCDYHLDINTQMNYYPTEVCNLAECHLPLMRLIESLSIAGKVTAENFYGCKGWVAHVFTNAWGFTAPGWNTFWGLHVTGGLWIASHLREHYEFSLDQGFLTQHAYPILREAAVFFLDYMVIHPDNGWLVTGPSNSPENSFYVGADKDHPYHLSMGSTLDQILVRDLFVFCLEAAEGLKVDSELQAALSEAISLLPPLKVGEWGQLQEWLEDYEEAMPYHRHLSHLVSVHPSHQVSPRTTPELSAAARKTLESRKLGDDLEDIEFTRAGMAAFYARLEDGESALEQLSHLISQLCFDNLFTYSKPGVAGAETNIFVVDGNFGGVAAVAEMLLQSHAGEIRLLPALPQAWSQGYVKGLRAKGNMEVDIYWKQGRLKEACIRAFSDGAITLCYQAVQRTLVLKSGVTYQINDELVIW
ncbi:glycoside hydrolase family 95 protein [Paenibacillus eucommiae]|uniref:Alpha-L-fucosidase 2 n=1 Tax=Paenibacillus eucommiae TaxID=1355755 RepID=A0ABS4IRI7_9BACL|nr:glycoside hydrolase family 95 protein [Paenibacillus eucommiae]MBP1990155.1 alpha-L-fucosidase 2 [Paenibacillus eucommiae]